INEPIVVSMMGYATGEHAPGQRNQKLAIQVAHNLLVGHGLATQAIKAADPHAQVGIVMNLTPVESETESEMEKRIAESQWNSTGAWFLDAIFKACYPPDILKSLGRMGP